MSNPKLIGGVGSPQSIHQTSTSKVHSLGTEGYLDERKFRYASNAGAAITLGSLCAQGASTANHVSVAYASGGAIGSDKITLTLGATAATANQYADGWLIGIDGTGSGQIRRIKSHPAADASATLELTLYDALTVAGAASSEWSLVPNEYAGIRVHPGGAGGVAHSVGVPAFTVPAGTTDVQYFWLQTSGPALVQGDGSAFSVGDKVVPGQATADAGQVTILSEQGTIEAVTLERAQAQVVGSIIDVGDATSDLDYRFVRLTLG